MKKLYKIEYGCYISMTIEFIETELSEEEIGRNVYDLAYQDTESWAGSHGFAVDEEEEELHETIEGACDYCFTEYDDSMASELEEYGVTQW